MAGMAISTHSWQLRVIRCSVIIASWTLAGCAPQVTVQEYGAPEYTRMQDAERTAVTRGLSLVADAVPKR